MDKKQLHSALQKWAEKDILPDSIDLWPAVEENLLARGQHHSKQGAMSMKSPTLVLRRAKWAALTGLVLMLLFMFFAATPAGKGLAQYALRFFLRSEQNSATLPTLEAALQVQPAELVATPLTDAALPAGCGSILLPRCSLAEVQPDVAFPIQLPAEVPAGMEFRGAVPIPDGVLIKLEGLGGILLLAESPVGQDLETAWSIGADTTVETVMVGNQPAEYVQGGWVGLGLEEDSLPWDEDFPTRTLRWQADGLQYTLVNFPQSSADGPLGLSLEQLQALAASLSAAQENVASGNDSDGLTIQQAQEKAGFAFVEPSWLPAGLVMTKITYDSQHNAICQHYRSDALDVAPTLVVAQSSWALPQVPDMQMKATYDGKELAIALTEQLVAVQGADGGQGTFAESGLLSSAFCGGEPASANRAVLWQQGARTNILFAQLDANDGRGFVTQAEMRRIAEAINGAEAAGQDTALDPERLFSLKDAEALTGIDLKLPRLMLSNVRFDHIAYRAEGDGPGMISATYAGRPVGDGRTYLVQVIQTPDSQMTLELLQMAGGYEVVMVRGEPGIYQAQCFDTTDLAGGLECRQFLTWFEGGTQYDVSAYFPARVPRETVFAIAESMR